VVVVGKHPVKAKLQIAINNKIIIVFLPHLGHFLLIAIIKTSLLTNFLKL
jgi:hypothetical protein